MTRVSETVNKLTRSSVTLTSYRKDLMLDCCTCLYQTAKEAPLLTPLEKALQWAEKGELDSVGEKFVPSREERLSFAALQPIAGTCP